MHISPRANVNKCMTVKLIEQDVAKGKRGMKVAIYICNEGLNRPCQYVAVSASRNVYYGTMKKVDKQLL